METGEEKRDVRDGPRDTRPEISPKKGNPTLPKAH